MSSETRQARVIPECRYGHGRLKEVGAKYPESGEEVRFAWIASKRINLMFVGTVFTCTSCGYTEFFDDQPDVTAARILEDGR
jgi:hypothetical protein